MLVGHGGQDELHGGDGNDVDILKPGAGNDVINGSKGQDLVVYEPERNPDGSLKLITLFVNNDGSLSVDENGDGSIDDNIRGLNASYYYPHSRGPIQETHDRIVIVAPSDYTFNINVGGNTYRSDQLSTSSTNNSPDNNNSPNAGDPPPPPLPVGGIDIPVVGPNQMPAEFLLSIVGADLRTLVSETMVDTLIQDAGVNSDLNLLRAQSPSRGQIDINQQSPVSTTVQTGWNNQILDSISRFESPNTLTINMGSQIQTRYQRMNLDLQPSVPNNLLAGLASGFQTPM